MGVYIHGMEMPKSCHDCEMSALVDVSDGLAYGCQALKEMIFNNRERLPNCPLVPVPPHGDLIDRDAFVKELEYDIELAQRALDGMECVGKDREILLLDKICKDNSIQYLSEAPVVVPASKEKET